MELLGIGLLLYLIPTFVAGFQYKRNFNAIFALNLLLGWSVIGWIAAFIWAVAYEEPVRI